MKIERINKWFARRGKGIIQRRWAVLMVFLLMFAIGVNGIRFLNISTSWNDYFLEDDPMLVQTEKFKEIFGNDNYAAVLTSCENTFTKENLELIRRLSNDMLDNISYADKITSLTDIEFMVGNEDGIEIEQIVPDEIPNDPDGLNEIKRKAFMKPYIANRLVSSDGKQTWILLKLRPFPAESEWKRNGSISPEMSTGGELEDIISKPEYAALNPKGSGMPYITDQKMKWVDKEMPRVMGLAMLLAIIVLAIATRSIRGVVVPIVTATSSIVMAYGLVGYLNFTIDSGMMMLPMLLAFAIAVAYNIHIHSYFKRQMLIHGKRKQAAVETIGEMGWPVLFSALTTFAALLSFLVIPVVPMHFIGITTSTSVMLTFLIAITIMPIVLSFGKDKEPSPESKHYGGLKLDRCLESFALLILKWRKAVWIIFFVITGFLLSQIIKIEAAFDVERTMGRKVPYVDEILKVAESELGAIYSYDVLIDLLENDAAKQPENLKALGKLSSIVESYPLTKRTTSILNILKDLNRTLHSNDENYYTVPESADEIAQQLLLYEGSGGSESEYWIDYDYRRLRLKIDLSRYNSAEAEKEMSEITKLAQELFPNAKISPVGSLPQFTTMMQYLVRGQITSFFIALLVIGILMMLVFGSVKTGLIGLIPNVMPAIVVGGLMGWVNYPLDMMTATIMPMILGLAVDDTIHFINHGHLEFDRQKSYKGAILKTFRIVGTPIVLTSIIITANFAAYTISSSTSFIHMGILSVAGMLAALLADLCITPLLFRKFKIFGKEENTQAVATQEQNGKNS
ncbi:MAG: MMPL family transporter [Porphyromonas sp.]|nr:MMPL family transporter [Porphyromonas sp.]